VRPEPTRLEGAPQAAGGEDDRELLRRYHELGDPTAREALVARHLALVRALARRYAGRGEPLDDIEQVGAIGLLKAIDRYDLSRTVALTTYATPTIVGEIKRYFRDKGWAIRIPRGLQELNSKMGTTLERLGSALGRSPSIAELAEELGTTPEEVLEALEAGSAYSPMSLSSTASGDSDLDPLEAIGHEDEGFERSEQRATLEPALETLPERERDILRMRFDHGLTQTQIAEQIGISQMHVSRLIRKALAQMRSEIGEP
jgi:RNA polymerase sigma-B factor